MTDAFESVELSSLPSRGKGGSSDLKLGLCFFSAAFLPGTSLVSRRVENLAISSIFLPASDFTERPETCCWVI